MRRAILCALATLAAGCASLGSRPSLGTYVVDEERVVVRAYDAPDTLAVLSWGDTLEVIDATPEERASDDLFVVRLRGRYGRVVRDAVMSDLLFRSKYSRGRAIVAEGARRFYLGEFGDTVEIRRRPNLVRKADEEEDVVVEKESLKRRGSAR